MNDIDEQIRQALSQEDAADVAQLNDQAGLMDLLAMSFKGKQAWLTWYSWIMGFAAFILGLYCLSRFFASDDLKISIAWALGSIACMFVLSIIKVISWQQMQKLEVLREIKRLELRLLLNKGN